MRAMVAGRYCSYRIDHVHTIRYATKNGIAEVATTMIEKCIVVQVNKKLRRCAVDYPGPRHRECAANIFLAIVSFILDWGACFFFRHVIIHAATLDHEIRNNPVKNSLCKKSVGYVLTKIFAGNGCGFFKKVRRRCRRGWLLWLSRIISVVGWRCDYRQR